MELRFPLFRNTWDFLLARIWILICSLEFVNINKKSSRITGFSPGWKFSNLIFPIILKLQTWLKSVFILQRISYKGTVHWVGNTSSFAKVYLCKFLLSKYEICKYARMSITLLFISKLGHHVQHILPSLFTTRFRQGRYCSKIPAENQNRKTLQIAQS